MLHGVIVNLVFAGLMLLMQAFIKPVYLGQFDAMQANEWIAGFLLLVILIEPIGMYLKAKNVSNWPKGGNVGYIFFWILHLGVNGVLLMSMIQFMGLELDSGWAMLLFVLNTLKELWVLWIIMGGIKIKPNKYKNLVADMVLVIVFVGYYLAFWEMIVATSPGIAPYHWPSRIFNSILVGVLYGIFFFLPVRALYLIEEFNSKNSRKGELLVWGSILVTTIAAVWPALTYLVNK